MSGEWPSALITMRDAGFRVVALTPRRGARPLETLEHGARTALLLGTEGVGLTEAALHHADEHVRIRTTDRIDSLNVTVAASIALHHVAAT
jgi:tRNA G18 (ribose-2'-O)-methylase SpoU